MSTDTEKGVAERLADVKTRRQNETNAAIARQQTKNEFAEVEEKGKRVKELFEKIKPTLDKAIPNRRVSVDYLISTALTLLRSESKLLECTPQSIAAAVIQAVQLDLRLDKTLGEAYLVPFKRQAQFLVGYRGLIKLASKCGALITSKVVHEWDFFEFEYGTSAFLKHRPTPRPTNPNQEEVLKSPDSQFPIYAYAYADIDKRTIFDVMDRTEIERVRALSKSWARDRQHSIWSIHVDEMCKKTVVRRLAKYLPLSVEFERAAELDELVGADVPQQLYVDDETGEVKHAEMEEVRQPAGEEEGIYETHLTAEDTDTEGLVTVPKVKEETKKEKSEAKIPAETTAELKKRDAEVLSKIEEDKLSQKNENLLRMIVESNSSVKLDQMQLGVERNLAEGLLRQKDADVLFGKIKEKFGKLKKD